jgi:hypothetical protein
MTRHLVLGLSLVGMLGAGSATAVLMHSAPAKAKAGELCIVLAKDDNHHNTQDYCVDWTAIQPR